MTAEYQGPKAEPRPQPSPKFGVSSQYHLAVADGSPGAKCCECETQPIRYREMVLTARRLKFECAT